jgi:hypothetical protein
MDEAETDTLPTVGSRSTTGPNCTAEVSSKRVTHEIKRRSDIAAMFSNETAVAALISALLLEQNEE